MRSYTPAQYRNRLKRLQNKIDKTNDVILKSAMYGARQAKKHAPKNTGTLFSAIGYRKSKTNQAWITQKNPGKENPNNQGQAFNYAQYMYELSIGKRSGKYRVRRGRIDYMREAARRTRPHFKTQVRAHITRAIKTTK